MAANDPTVHPEYLYKCRDVAVLPKRYSGLKFNIEAMRYFHKTSKRILDLQPTWNRGRVL